MILPLLPRFRGALKDETRKKSLIFIIDGMLINASLVLSSGMFLSGYVIFLGGSDFLVGILNNALTWASIVAVFSFIIFERMEKRKKLLLPMLCVSRLLICLVIFVPLVFGKTPATLTVLTVMVVLGNVLWGAYSVGYSVWMMNSFSKETRSAFIFRRLFFLRITFTVFTVLMGFVLDWSGKSYMGFVMVFLTSLVLGLGDVAILLKAPEPVYVVTEKTGFRLRELVDVLKNKPFVNFVVFTFLFYLCNSISASFSSLYLIRYMKLDYSFISLISVITYFFMIFCTKPWSRMDRWLRPVTILRISGFLIIIELFALGFLTTGTTFILYITPVLTGIGNSGFNAFTYLYRFDLMPENNRTIYEGICTASNGLSLLLGPVIGGFFIRYLPVFENSWIQYSKFQLTFFISFFLAAMVLILALRGFKIKPEAASCDAS